MGSCPAGKPVLPLVPVHAHWGICVRAPDDSGGVRAPQPGRGRTLEPLHTPKTDTMRQPPERARPSFLRPPLPGGAVAANARIGGPACAPPHPAPRRPPPPLLGPAPLRGRRRGPRLGGGQFPPAVRARVWARSERTRRRLPEHSGQSCGLRVPLLPPRVPRWLPRPTAAPAPRAPLCPRPGAAAAAGSEPVPWATEAAAVRARCRGDAGPDLRVGIRGRDP